MAIIDLPTTGAFRGAQFSLGLDVSESTYTGFLTGNRTRRSNLADRLRGTLTLPPCVDAVQAAAREALLMGMRSNGDWLRLAMPHRKFPNGSMRGSPVLSASAAAGARSISISGALAWPNLLTGGSFELDANANGVGDGWAAYSAGAVTSPTYALSSTTAVRGTLAQALQATSLGAGTSDRVGVSQTVLGVAGGQVYTLSAYLAWLAASTASYALYVDWLDVSNAIVGSSSTFGAALTGTLQRYSFTATAPGAAVKANVFIFLHSRAGGAGAADARLDAAQFEVGSTATTFESLPTLAAGDWLAIGGNLLQVGYAGATGTDAGAVASVPLSMPLPKAVSAGAAVTWAAPTGVWELDDDGLQLDYTAGVVQGGVAIPLRQVVQ